jgi:putative endopeptidase
MRASLGILAILVVGLGGAAVGPSRQAKPDFLAANVDPTISPREDFFQYANGNWFKRNPIPDDQGSWGISNLVVEDVQARQRRIMEAAATNNAPEGGPEQLLGDLWSAAMDTAKRNREGLAPLRGVLEHIDRIRSVQDLVAHVTSLHAAGWRSVLWLHYIAPDDRNSDRMILSFWQGGIHMNAPSYYTATDSPTVRVRNAFREYLTKTLARIYQEPGKAQASADAAYELEAAMARAYYQADGYQLAEVSDLRRIAPTIDWAEYFRVVGLRESDSINVGKPRYLAAIDSLLRTVPLEHWKDHLRFWHLRNAAGFLDDTASADQFALRSASMGVRQPPPRWISVVGLAGGLLGQPLARLLAADYLPPAVKARYAAMAEGFRDALRARIDKLEWMSDSTKQNAQRKLAVMRIRIGYPDTGRDYSTLQLARDSHWLNLGRIVSWNRDREVRSLRAPVDRTDWQPSPAMNDAGYDDSGNSLNIEPATILIPGWRDDELDDALVYGYTYLGHEISHGFDNVGRRYDAAGNRRDWWTAQDATAFQERAQVMVDQYNAFTPVEGLHVDGRRTLRENIADLAGVRIALDAFKKTEQFRRGEKIGGFTPLQRFFLGYAARRMRHARPQALATTVRSDSHAPDRERVNGVLVHIPEFYEAFGIRPGDRMYRAESARVKIW